MKTFVTICIILLLATFIFNSFDTNADVAKANKHQHLINFSLASDLEEILEAELENIAEDIADTDTLENKIPDTISFKYHFVPGDSIFYAVFSSDSIIINYDDPLLRLRQEKLLITCDSINSKGNFCLTQRLIAFRGVESYQDEKNVERTTSEWLNVPVYLELDSLGRRIKVFNADTNSAAATPGGVFHPVVFMPLALTNINKKAENESWLNSTTDYLVENSMPVPIFKNTTLMRLIGLSDTLGFHTLRFMFSRSGQASHELVTKAYSMKTTGIINSGGELFLDTTYWLPIYISCAMDQKLTFYYPDNKDQPGWHYLKTTFVLENIKRPAEAVIPNNLLNNKNNKIDNKIQKKTNPAKKK